MAKNSGSGLALGEACLGRVFIFGGLDLRIKIYSAAANFVCLKQRLVSTVQCLPSDNWYYLLLKTKRCEKIIEGCEIGRISLTLKQIQERVCYMTRESAT